MAQYAANAGQGYEKLSNTVLLHSLRYCKDGRVITKRLSLAVFWCVKVYINCTQSFH